MSEEKTNNETVNIDEVINRLLATMQNHEPYSEEYNKMADQLEKLAKFKATTAPDKVSKDSLLAVIGNLTGILLILGHEYTGPLTSKALSFVLKSKI